MSDIILRENEWAEEQIRTSDLGTRPSVTLKRVARYYLDQGLSRNKIKKLLTDFLIKCDPHASLVSWGDTIDYAIKRAIKHPAIDIASIPITDEELAVVGSLKGRQVKRLAFTLLCLAKYTNIINPNADGWINIEDGDIMRMANIKTSLKRQALLYRELCEQGLIQTSKKVDSISMKILFIKEGSVVLDIADYRNLGNQYLMYCGEPYFTCERCGLTIKDNTSPKGGRKRKYCPKCASEMAIQRKVNRLSENKPPRKKDKN